MVLGSLNHHHLMIFSPDAIAFNGFSMVSRFQTPMQGSMMVLHPKKFKLCLMKYEVQHKVVKEPVRHKRHNFDRVSQNLTFELADPVEEVDPCNLA